MLKSISKVENKTVSWIVASSIVIGVFIGPVLAVTLCPNLKMEMKTGKVVQR